MPTYQYRCTECGQDLEVVQKFSDASLTECPNCHGSLRKVYNAVGVVFKGSGFYSTDNRTNGAKAAANGSESSSSNSESKSDSKSESGSGKSESGSSKSESGSGKSESSGSKSESSGSKSESSGSKAPAKAAAN